jgi:hypothetical protein
MNWLDIYDIFDYSSSTMRNFLPSLVGSGSIVVVYNWISHLITNQYLCLIFVSKSLVQFDFAVWDFKQYYSNFRRHLAILNKIYWMKKWQRH